MSLRLPINIGQRVIALCALHQSSNSGFRNVRAPIVGNVTHDNLVPARDQQIDNLLAASWAGTRSREDAFDSWCAQYR